MLKSQSQEKFATVDTLFLQRIAGYGKPENPPTEDDFKALKAEFSKLSPIHKENVDQVLSEMADRPETDPNFKKFIERILLQDTPVEKTTEEVRGEVSGEASSDSSEEVVDIDTTPKAIENPLGAAFANARPAKPTKSKKAGGPTVQKDQGAGQDKEEAEIPVPANSTDMAGGVETETPIKEKNREEPRISSLDDVLEIIDKTKTPKKELIAALDAIYYDTKDLFHTISEDIYNKYQGEGETLSAKELKPQLSEVLTRFKSFAIALDKKRGQFSQGKNESDGPKIKLITDILAEQAECVNDLKKLMGKINAELKITSARDKELEKDGIDAAPKEHPLDSLLSNVPANTNSTGKVEQEAEEGEKEEKVEQEAEPESAPAASPTPAAEKPAEDTKKKTKKQKDEEKREVYDKKKREEHEFLLSRMKPKPPLPDVSLELSKGDAIAALGQLFENLSSGSKFDHSDIPALKAAIKEMSEFSDIFGKGIVDDAHVARVNYFNQHSLNRFITMRESVIKNLGVKASEIGQTLKTATGIAETIRAIADDQETREVLRDMFIAIKTLQHWTSNERAVTAPEPEPARSAPAENTIEEPVEEPSPEVPPEANPTPQPDEVHEPELPEGYVEIKKVEDMFAPRDVRNKVPDEIAHDAGFDTWIKGIFSYTAKKHKKFISTQLTEEDYYEIYREQAPKIAEIKAWIESGAADTLSHGLSEAELKVNRVNLLEKLQADLYESQTGDLDELPLMKVIHESQQRLNDITQAEQAYRQVEIGTRRTAGYIDPEDVYVAINKENPEKDRFDELNYFVQDMANNYEFYQGRGGSPVNEDVNSMFIRYKKAHTKTEHVTKKIGKLQRLWTVFFKKAPVVDSTLEAEKVRFAENIQLLRRNGLAITANTKEARELVEAKMVRLQEFIKKIELDVADGKDPLDESLFDANDLTNSRLVEGREIFKNIYRPYTDKRALDTSMQKQAYDAGAEARSATIEAEENIDVAKKEYDDFLPKLKGLVGSPKDYEKFIQQAKISVAIDKLKKVIDSLKNIKKSAKADPDFDLEDDIKVLEPGGVHKQKNDAAIKEAITLYSSAQEILNAAKPDDLGPEEQSFIKRASAAFLTKMSSLGEGISRVLLDVVAKDVEKFEAIAQDTSISNADKLKFKNKLSANLTEQIAKTPLVIDKMRLTNVEKKLQEAFANVKTK